MNDKGDGAASKRARAGYCAAFRPYLNAIPAAMAIEPGLSVPQATPRPAHHQGSLVAACALALALAPFTLPASAASCTLGSDCGAAGGNGGVAGGVNANGGMGNGAGGGGAVLGTTTNGGPGSAGNGGKGGDGGIGGSGGSGGTVGATSIGGGSISGHDGGNGLSHWGGSGGGGGGGTGVYSSATTLTIGTGLTITGGDGGDGGTDGLALNGGGGGGGAGLVSNAANAAIATSGNIAGGDGGDGGSSDPLNFGGGGGGGDGVVLFGDNAVLTNGGAIAGGSGGMGGPSASSGGGGDGVRVLGHGGTVINYGSITTPLTSSPGISGNSGIFMLNDGTVTNERGGSISAGQTGVYLLGGGAVTNDASTISGGSDGIVARNASSTVINRNGASIAGDSTGVSLRGGGTLINDASTISGGGYGVGADLLATVINQNGASISGTGYGIELAGGGTVTNDGTGSSITASTAIIGVGAMTITNQDGATVSGVGQGIELMSGGTVTNGAGSTIKVTGTTGGDCSAGGNCAIYVKSGALDFSNAGSVIGKVQLDGSAANAVTLVGGGSIAGDLDIGANTASTLTLDGSGTQLYSQAVTGTTTFAGALAKQGSGTWVINGTLAPASTTVDAGKLVVGDDSHPGASLGGAITLKPGGALGGIGAIGTLVNSGTIAPGGSIGTLNVTGNYVSNTGSVYQVEIDPAGHSDLIKVAGTATLNGGKVQALAQNGTYQPSTQYTILTAAGGLTGRYDSVTSNLAFLTPSLSYDPDAVYLTMTRNQANFADAGVSPNQRAAGAALDAGSANQPAGLAAVYTALLNATTAQVPEEIDSLSGNALTVFPLIAQDDARRFSAKLSDRALGHGAPAGFAMLDPRVRLAFAGENLAQLLAQTNASAYGAAPSADPGGWSGWVTAGGARNHVGGDGNGPGFSANSGEIALGLERQLIPDLRVGAAAGYTDTSADVNDNRNASGDLHSWHVGAYLGYQRGPWFADGSAAYSSHHIYTTRNLTVGGTGRAKASFAADTLALWGEAGRHFNYGALDIDPSATLRVMSTHTPDFSESGAASALQVKGGHLDSQRLGIGVRFSGITHANGAAIRPSAAIRYEHEFGDSTATLSNRLTGLDAFTVKGPQPGREIVSANLAINAQVKRHLTVYGGVDASWRQNQNTQAIEVGLKYVW